MSSPQHLQFITGKLAAPALKRIVESLADREAFDFTIDVLPITVAALMTPDWIARHWTIDPNATRILLPGYCAGDLTHLRAEATVPVELGPRDMQALPEWLGSEPMPTPDWNDYSIEILAEINLAPRMTRGEILSQARELSDAGANLIDVGCDPSGVWNGVGDCIRALRDAGHRVSIDSLHPQEIEAAVRSGAELVLSVNQSNRDAAADWGCEVVAIPDDPATLAGLDETLACLDRDRVAFRIDPILEPIGFGLGASLLRYAHIRQKFPEAAMLMGIGNITELTDVDSAGLNLLLLALCQEWRIHSVLTTQVINWARTSIRECDLARRLVYHAVVHSELPKNKMNQLIMLRDPRLYEQGAEQLQQLMQSIRDSNYRLFAEDDRLHVISANLHLSDRDPFDLFAQLLATNPGRIDASHAFYLGYELCKARTALTLAKQYRQDESLDWGFLTEAEHPHRGRAARSESE